MQRAMPTSPISTTNSSLWPAARPASSSPPVGPVGPASKPDFPSFQERAAPDSYHQLAGGDLSMAAEQRAIPMISYENVVQAVQSLTRMFGFRENAQQRYTEPDGRVSHAELDLDGARVMLGTPGPDYQSPKHHRSACEAARRWSEKPYIID